MNKLFDPSYVCRNDLTKKRGRPKMKDPKNPVCGLRLNKKDIERLNFIIEKTGMRKTDILREGLRTFYNIVMYRD